METFALWLIAGGCCGGTVFILAALWVALTRPEKFSEGNDNGPKI